MSTEGKPARKPQARSTTNRRAADPSITRLHGRVDDLYGAVTNGLERLNERFDDTADKIAEIQVAGERREQELKALNVKMDGAQEADHASLQEHDTRLKALETHIGLLKTAAKAGRWVSGIVGLILTGLTLGLFAAIIKKTTGYDIAPWLHLADGK